MSSSQCGCCCLHIARTNRRPDHLVILLYIHLYHQTLRNNNRLLCKCQVCLCDCSVSIGLHSILSFRLILMVLYTAAPCPFWYQCYCTLELSIVLGRFVNTIFQQLALLVSHYVNRNTTTISGQHSSLCIRTASGSIPTVASDIRVKK
jgi:hypothetical protein